MATSYPDGLDAFTGTTLPTTSTAAEVGGRTHSKRHDDVEDAVEAIEAELGTSPKGAAASVKDRLDTLDTTVATKAATATVASTYLPKSTDRSRAARQLPATWSLATDGLAALASSGLTTSGGYVAASVGGTDGTAIFPIWGQKDFRASFRVKVTKATASSKSCVGFTVSTPGSLPSAGNFTFTVGYLQGTGLAFIRENVGAAISLVADASLADGDEYDVSLWVDTTLNTAATQTVGYLNCRISKAGTETIVSVATFNLVNFPVNNAMVRTNVAAGSITNLVFTSHPTGAVYPGTGVACGEVSYGSVSETTYLRLPATPNGKLVIAIHGHGGTPTETGNTSTTYKPTWNALTDAGYTVAVPLMGGNLWGNNTAQTWLATLHSLLTTKYDLDPDVFIWGNSMGGGAALTAAAKGTIPIRAMYLAEPVCDLAYMAGTGSFPTIGTAYPTTAERDANDPMKFPASAFAGVPMLFTASASDTTVSKVNNTDAMRTKLGSTVPNYLITATGIHADPSHFRPFDTLNFFRANAHRDAA